MRLQQLAVAVAVAAGLSACAGLTQGIRAQESSHHVSPKARLSDLKRARVWAKTDVGAKDLKAGPDGKGAFAPDETVTCKYHKKVMTGNSPKFNCVIPP